MIILVIFFEYYRLKIILILLILLIVMVLISGFLKERLFKNKCHPNKINKFYRWIKHYNHYDFPIRKNKILHDKYDYLGNKILIIKRLSNKILKRYIV